MLWIKAKIQCYPEFMKNCYQINLQNQKIMNRSYIKLLKIFLGLLREKKILNMEFVHLKAI
ncbi:hypothetical protein CWI39_2292p0010, partial [Hamiltosporidium magnivora]